MVITSGVSISPLSLKHVESITSKALAAVHASPHADTDLGRAAEALASLPAFDPTQQLNRAAELLHLADSLTSGGRASIFHYAAAAAVVYQWVWAVTTVVTSCPTLIDQQEREAASLAAHLLFERLPEALKSWASARSSSGSLDAPEGDGLPAGEPAALVAAAAAGAAAVGLLELQEWVREGVVPAELPIEYSNLAPLAEALALAAMKLNLWEGGSQGTWVVEEGVLPFLYYATQHSGHHAGQEAVVAALSTISGDDKRYSTRGALVRYCRETLTTITVLFNVPWGDPWQVPNFKPLVLALGLVGSWPGGSAAGVLQELKDACGNTVSIARVARELLDGLWATAGKAGERAERLAWAARAAVAAESLCMTCISGEQGVAGDLSSFHDCLTILCVGIAPSALVAVSTVEQLAAWRAAGMEEQGYQHSIQHYGLQQVTLRQLEVLLNSLKCLHGHLDWSKPRRTASEVHRRDSTHSGTGCLGGPHVASFIGALARLTAFLAQQQQRGGFAALGLLHAAERCGLELEHPSLESALFGAALCLECTYCVALNGVDLPGLHQPLSLLPEPTQLQALAHALAARAYVLLSPQPPGAGEPLLSRRTCAKSLAPSIANACLLVLWRSQLDGGSEQKHLRDYSAVAWVLAPAAAALLKLAAEEGHGEGTQQLVDSFANLAMAGLGDMVAWCGGGAVLHLGFEVPEHDVPLRIKALAGLRAACKKSSGLCVSLGREGFLERLVGTAVAFGASRQGTVISRSKHLAARLGLLASACCKLDEELGTAFQRALLAVDGASQCIGPGEPTAQLRSRLKERQLWDEVQATVVGPLTERCHELYEEACQQEETCALRDLAVGRWAGVCCCNPGCCGEGGWGCERKLKTCTGCRVAKFCSQECQKKDWPRHKPACRVFAQRGCSR